MRSALRSFFCLAMAAAVARAAAPPLEPPFDLQAIRNDPLEAETTQSELIDGMVVEHVAFKGDRAPDGTFIRLNGILAYPEGGRNLPGLLWCQGGMGDAATYFPLLFARKGYLCLHITLAKQTWNAYARFDTDDPSNANLVRFAVEQMRGVTCIANRPEVNPDKLGVAGASYGGVFSTFVAGADPRIKAGMSFFAAGNHHLGSNLPQFTSLRSLEELEVFKRVGDGAAYIRQRDVPFIWGLPTNDNWFYFPAVIETFRQKPGEKRIAIIPHWVHGFPPELDQQLFDWFDIYLKQTRAPYLQPGTLTLKRSAAARDGEEPALLAEWPWSGTPAARRAELVVSYGRALPWHGWRHRYYHTVPADIEGQTARAEIPVPDPDLPLLVFGTVFDENDVRVSTDPVEAMPRALGLAAATGRPVTDGCPRGRFEPQDMQILQGTAQGFGRADTANPRSGTQCVAMDPPPEGRKPPRGSKARVMLFNVYEHDHRLFVWLRAERPATVDVTVQALPPANWNTPAVRAILADMPEAAEIPPEKDIPAFTLAAELGPDWKEFAIDVPCTGVAIEGYELRIDRRPGNDAIFWIDDVRFETQWKDCDD